jgi:hypothetical protein
MFFVFDIEDMREKSTYAVKQLLDILPKELVDKIAFYLGCNKSKYEYTLTDFPVIFESETQLLIVEKALNELNMI